jgi:hypothetical protein
MLTTKTDNDNKMTQQQYPCPDLKRIIVPATELAMAIADSNERQHYKMSIVCLSGGVVNSERVSSSTQSTP